MPPRTLSSLARGACRRLRPAAMLAIALALAPSTALACPTCGIGDRFGPATMTVYGLFMAAPFLIAYFVARTIRRLDR